MIISVRWPPARATSAVCCRVGVLLSLIPCVVSAGCRRNAGAPPPLVAQVDGTIEIGGLSDTVRVVRDRWGIPHIYARNRDDLFFAQGFVQAQDRLFQMDLWRRSVQGRLSEVLGPNFIERDAMTKRIQYRGDIDAEWAAYGPDTRAIAAAFVRGVNAWVARARERPPEAFVLAGWTPELWSPSDLLNRTDAFLASGDAIDEIARGGLSEVVADAVRRVGTPPFFSGLAAQVRANTDALENGQVRLKPPFDTAQGGPKALEGPETTNVATNEVSVSRGGVLSLTEASTRLDHPGLRYLVHLHAPGWNAIGATKPWLPGVAIGHNERIAWAAAPAAADTQDIYADAAPAAHRTVAKDTVVVKGRKAPFEFDVEQTPHGVVIASDRARDRVFTLRWSGTEPGGAGELGAIAVDRAGSWVDFRAALTAWRMPARRIVFADVDGNIGFQDAGRVPIRKRSGLSERDDPQRVEGAEWVGWATLDDLPHAYNPRGAIAVRGARRDGAASAAPVVFAHVLAITAPARARFNVGPLPRPASDGTLRARFDPRQWDRSQIVAAPGQSESPDSPHFGDLVQIWSRGELVPLVFSDTAVQAETESTLTLIPRMR